MVAKKEAMMNILNGVFVVLLVVLIGFGAFGYLYNEYQDLHRENENLRQANAGLIQENENCRLEGEHRDARNTELEVLLNNLEDQVGIVQGELVQCHTDTQNAQQGLAICTDDLKQTQQTLFRVKADLNTCQAAPMGIDSQPWPSNQDELSTQGQVQTPQLAAVAPEAIVLLVTGIGGVIVMVALIFRTRVHKLQDVPQPVQCSAAPRPNPKQVTVKMNSQAYQSYLDYLKSAKK
jgi:hypothetical protein